MSFDSADSNPEFANYNTGELRLAKSRKRMLEQESHLFTPRERRRLLLDGQFASAGDGGGIPERDPNLPSPLTILEQTNHVFIQTAGVDFVENFYNLENRFDLLNSKGERIYYAGETLQPADSPKKYGIRASFDVTVLSPEGAPVLSITGRHGLTTVTDFHDPLGYVAYKKGGPFWGCCCRQVYSIQDKNKKELFVMTRVGRPESNSAGEFEIVDVKTRYLMGRVSKNWIGEVPPQSGWINAYGVGFVGDVLELTDLTIKALFLGALFTVLGADGFTNLGAFMQTDF